MACAQAQKQFPSLWGQYHYFLLQIAFVSKQGLILAAFRRLWQRPSEVIAKAFFFPKPAVAFSHHQECLVVST